MNSANLIFVRVTDEYRGEEKSDKDDELREVCIWAEEEKIFETVNSSILLYHYLSPHAF